MNTIIIGGGIAGLYTAYRLLNLDPTCKITLLEADATRLGGRVHTVKRDGIHMDAGAGRFAGPDQHPCVWALIRDFDLEEQVIELPKHHVTYVKDGKKVAHAHLERIHADLRKAARASLSMPSIPSIPSTMSFEMWARSVLKSESDVHDLIYSSGYQSPFDRMSAADAMNSFLLSTWKYYIFRNGMRTLTDALERYLRNSGRCEIVLGAKVECVERLKDGGFKVSMHDKHGKHDKHGNHDMHSKSVYLCITRDALIAVAKTLLLEVPGLYEAVKASRVSSLDRIYARFPVNKDGEPWFSNSNVTSNGMVRQFIPINLKKGVAMACYTEGIYAEQWGDVKSWAKLKELLMTGLSRMFHNDHIPDPLWIKRHHWAIGAHYDAVGGCPVATALKRKPSDNGWQLAGESVSRHHKGWVEGALSSVSV